MSKTQVDLSTFEPQKEEIKITRTIRCKLETSNHKTELVKQGINAYQSVLSYMADRLPTYPEHEWTPHHTHMYHQSKRGLPDDDVNYRTTLAQKAQQQVAEAFKGWSQRGKPGKSPQGDFGHGSYLGLKGRCVEIVANDRGYGLKASFISRNPVWFHIDAGDHQRQFLRKIVDEDDDTRAGSAELHLHENGELYCHLTVSWPVETYTVEDVNTTVGVDLNVEPLVAVAVWSEVDSAVREVHLESGNEFRHHRQRMKRAKDQAMADGNLKTIKDARRNYEKYTDHITNVASRRVVDMAETHSPCQIQLEDLTHLRERVEDAKHDWPYAMIQEQIVYKAQEHGIPVVTVDPRDTSRECRKCGTVHPKSRDEKQFKCIDCGYEVHADVNAAINIAQRSS